MRVLIDTNIFIHREGQLALSENFQQLIKKLNENTVKILVHPLSIEEIKEDKDEKRREVSLSKMKTYQTLDSPPDQKDDAKFGDIVGKATSRNEEIDNAILYAAYRDAVDFLITEDKKILKKALKLGLSERVLSIGDAVDLFKRYFPEAARPPSPPSINEVPMNNLDINDHFFDALKVDYPEFSDWFKKKSREGRQGWVYYNQDKTIGALLIYKIEEDALESILPLDRRLKVCLFKSEVQGQKIGELFIKIAIDFAIKSNVSEMFLTHFTKDSDSLVSLIANYGFYKVGINTRREEVFLKKLIPEKGASADPLEIARKYYPSFYDGENVNKFIIPIRPEYHDRLFIEQSRTPSLLEYTGDLIIEGNTISKAYLCNSKIKKMKPGDVVLFYRSASKQGITCIGTIEKVHMDQHDPNTIRKIVGKRTVYALSEIEQMSKKPTLVIQFRWHFNLKKIVKYEALKQLHIMVKAPQSIMQINEEHYKTIKKEGELDEHFTVT